MKRYIFKKSKTHDRTAMKKYDKDEIELLKKKKQNKIRDHIKLIVI